MRKFKVGDKVIRTGKTFGEAIKGSVYVVSGVSYKAFDLVNSIKVNFLS